MLDGSIDVASAHVSAAECGDDGCDWRQAHAALQQIARRRAVLDVEEAHWLVIAKRTRVHVELGFATMLEYMERLLGYGRRVAFERMRVAERLEDLPETRELLAAGAITYSAVRELTRVADPDTEHEWLTEIEGKTVREIEDRLAGVAMGDAPEDVRDPVIERRRWCAELDGDVYAAMLEARRVIEEEHGGALDDNAFITLKSKGGVIGSMILSWTNYGVEENYTVLYCTKGVMALGTDPEYGVIVNYRNGEREMHKVGEMSTNIKQVPSGIIDSFTANILTKTPPTIDGDEGYKSLDVILTAMEAAKEGKTKKIGA